MNQHSILSSVHLALVGITVALACTPALAQRRGRDPHLAYAYPAGCERGTTCEITLGGQFLREANEYFLSGDGVQIEILDWYKPMSRGQYNNLRMKLRDAQAELTAQLDREVRGAFSETEVAMLAGVTEDQLREMEIHRQRDRDPKRQPNDQLEETVRIRVTVDADASLGKREIRLIDGTALSNPLWVHVGRWREVSELPPSDILGAGDKIDDIVDTMPIVINGQILPGTTDRFVIQASKGMKLVIQADAREVIPYLADAVPGWFQAVLRLTDENRKEVAYADSFQFRQDPVIYFEVPQDGRYIIEIRDALYRGREDFVYRLTVGEIPVVTGIFPLGARVDSEQTIQIRGWNLTNPKMSVTTMKRGRYRPVMTCRSVQAGGVSVEFPLQIDFWPEVFDHEPNNTPENAQPVTIPQTIHGRINYPGDEDVYKIRGGGRLVAEVMARRVGSPLDSVLRLTDAEGTEVAFNDDFEDLTQALQTHHADSLLTATLPGGREHYLHITNAQHDGGSEFTYRLTLRQPQPDYDLRVTPSNIIAKPGQVVPINVFVMRKDGLEDDIEVSLIDTPEHIQLDGNIVPGNATRVPMTLSVAANAKTSTALQPTQLFLQGSSRSRRRGRAIIRPAIPAENMMQAFIWHHLVPVENWNLIVNGKPSAAMPFSISDEKTAAPLSLSLKRKTFVPLQIESTAFVPNVLFIEVADPVAGITASVLKTDKQGFAIGLEVNNEGLAAGKQIKPGQRGNLLLRVYKEVTVQPTEENTAPPPQRTDYGYLPALPYTISDR